tara:strand:+ start:183 stop:1010 length:828 start_codon:yes stop_codon:yes gene_type:complete
MKILIPFSGGINSTYSLWRWLSDTDDEIIVRYGIDRFEDEEYNLQQLKNVQKIYNYLRKEYRDFDFQVSEFPREFVSERIPVRPGFKVGTYDIGTLRPRYAGYINWCFETEADAITIGICLENTATQGYEVSRRESGIENIGVDLYLGGVKELIPVPTGDDFIYDDIAKTMIGRFEQYEALPTELKNMCVRHDLNQCSIKYCRDCAYHRTYQKFVSEGKTGKDFDLHCAKGGSYGPWRHEADPETYRYRGAGKMKGVKTFKSLKEIPLPYLIYND